MSVETSLLRLLQEGAPALRGQILRPYPDLNQQARQVHTITDRFSIANTYLINGERLVIVDPGSELNVRLMLTYLRDVLHRAPDEIDLIVLTHLHSDHTAGVKFLRRVNKASVAASIAARQLALEAQEKLGTPGMPGITQLAGEVLRQKTLPATLRHMDLFPPHYANQVELIDLWLEDVAGLPYHPDWRVVANSVANSVASPESICLYNPFSFELLCGDVITIAGGTPLLRGATNRSRLEETLQTLRDLEVHYLYPCRGRPILAQRPLENASVD